jgi:replicative DNA helicase
MRFSIEAEQSVIGGLLLDPNRLDDVLEICTADDFYNIDNRAIFAAICDMGATGKTVDVITLSEKLNDSGELERVGGLGYLVEIANNTPSAANVKAYASILADRAMERRITEAGQRIAELGDNESIQVDDKLDTLHAELSGLERNGNFESVKFDQILKNRVEVIDGKFRGTAKRGMMTGFKALDERFQGIGDSDLWVIAARPAMGKTAFAMNIVYNIARTGKEVLVFSMEMTKEQLADRLLANASGIESNLIRSGQLEEYHWPSLSAGVMKLKSIGIHIVDIPAIDIHHAKAIARKFAKQGNLGMIMVDYLQLMRDTKAKSRFDEVSSVSRELKVMAKTCGCPIIALSQLNRGVEGQANKRPSLKDLRESGQIEQDADLITFIYRDEYYHENTPNKGTAELITAKFREGEVGTDILGTQLQFSRFIDVDFSSYVFDWSEQQQKPTGRRSFD